MMPRMPKKSAQAEVMSVSYPMDCPMVSSLNGALSSTGNALSRAVVMAALSRALSEKLIRMFTLLLSVDSATSCTVAFWVRASLFTTPSTSRKEMSPLLTR